VPELVERWPYLDLSQDGVIDEAESARMEEMEPAEGTVTQ